jgi:hypothetical protein
MMNEFYVKGNCMLRAVVILFSFVVSLTCTADFSLQLWFNYATALLIVNLSSHKTKFKRLASLKI